MGAYDSLVLAAATRYQVPAALVSAIIQKESGGDPRAFNPEGAGTNPSRGLMQVRWSTALGLGFTGKPESLFDPAVNIDLGAKLLRQLWDQFNGRLEDVVAAYNGGPKMVTQRMPGAAYRNQDYVDKVLAFMREHAARPLVVGPVVLLAAILVAWYWWKARK